MIRILRLHAVLLLLLCAACLHGQSYTTVVVFGDSLSDTGNIAHLTSSQYLVRYPGGLFNYADGRFTDATTTLPASKAYAGVWVEQLAAQFPAKPAVTNSLDGGTNYAYGGATTMDGYQTISGSSIVPGAPAVSVTIANMGQQIANYLATNPTVAGSTLYVVFGGGNDLLNDPSQAGVTAAAQREATLVGRLIAAGATSFIVPNLPPLGATPGALGTAAAAPLNAAAAGFRTLLAADLQVVQATATAQGKTVQIYQPDLYTQFTMLEAGPASYGFSNATASAQGSTTQNADTSVFWDTIHPTTTGHHLIAATAETLLAPLVTSTTTLTASAGITTPQTPITLTAVVTGTGPTAKPGGLISFFSGSGTGSTLIASGVLDATGTATASFTGALAGSPYSVYAVYAGDLAYARSASTAQAVTIATAIPTATTLLLNAGTYNAGSALPLSATVTSSNGTPSGSVTFDDGTTSLGTSTLNAGMATLSNAATASLAVGAHTLTASYAASGMYAASTSPGVAITIVNPVVALSLMPATLTLQHGSSASTTVVVAPQSVIGNVTLSCGTLPAHASCSFSPATFAVAGGAASSSTLTIGTTSASAAAVPSRPGTHPFTTEVYAAALLPLFGLGWSARRRLRSVARLCLAMVILGVGLTGLTGCSSNSTPPSTAAGTYSVVITATVSGTGATSQTTLTLTVQ